jgi:predicted ATPase
MKDPENYTNHGGTSKGYGYGNAIIARFKSHGEVLEPIVIAPLLTAKDSVILLDEPESGLSITNQFRLIDAIKIAVENNCQFFIATHCYPLIMAFDDIISLEHRKQMTSAEFIKRASKI